jgi:uncharacterized protein
MGNVSLSFPALPGTLPEPRWRCRGALFWPGQQSALIVADLHLEKGSAFARRGWLLPPHDSLETLGSWLIAAVERRGRSGSWPRWGTVFTMPRVRRRMPAAARLC